MRKAIAITAALLTVLAITQAASAVVANDIPGTVKVQECLLGIAVDPAPMDFGLLFPGDISPPVMRDLTVNGILGGNCKITIAVSFKATDWAGAGGNAMPSTQTTVSVVPLPPLPIPLADTFYGDFGIGVHTMDFVVTIPNPQAADTYSQTVTVTGTY